MASDLSKDNLTTSSTNLTVAQARIEIERALAKQPHHKMRKQYLRAAVQRSSRRIVKDDVLNEALLQLVKLGRIKITNDMIARNV